jgi:hypothetical protein
MFQILTSVNIKKEFYYSEIKSLNNLQPYIKSPNYDIKVFKPALKEYSYLTSTLQKDLA